MSEDPVKHSIIQVIVNILSGKGNEMEFRNTSGRVFYDVSEEWRSYIYQDGSEYLIDRPLKLSISKSGHYVFDFEGTMHFIPYGWVAIQWQSTPDGVHISIPDGSDKVEIDYEI